MNMVTEKLNEEETNSQEVETQEETSDETKTEGEDSSTEGASESNLQEEVDELDQILASLEESSDEIQTAVDEVKSSGGGEAEVTKLVTEIKKKDGLIGELSESVTALQDKIKKLNLDKSDLVYKNAELEAFGGVQDPQLMIVVRNFEKAKAGDKGAQGKIKSIISDIRSGIYGSDIEKDQIDSGIDAITEVDAYVSKRNPNVKMEKDKNTTPVF